MTKSESINETKKTNSNFTWPIKRVYKNHYERLLDPVVLEEPLEILLNGKSIAVLMRMPGQEKELAMGFCVSEGYVRQAKDVLLIHHCGMGYQSPSEIEEEKSPESRNRVELLARTGTPALTNSKNLFGKAYLRFKQSSSISESLPILPMDLTIDAAIILELGKAMRKLQTLHPKVGGTHSAALFKTSGEAVTQAEDIGRHNALDKVVGYCLLRRIPLEDKILVTSGRASYEMVTKAIRTGVAVVATISAPTSLALQIAKENGLTMIGYLRGERMNVYTHAERLQKL